MSSTPSAAAESAARVHILVIDDDPSIRSLLVGVLSRNYTVSVASDGQSGFQQAKIHPPDIAVIDIQMPGWDGLQTLTEFRKDPQLSGVATIILTADASRDTVLAAIQAGADDYVIKTAFSREDFERKIRRLLQRQAVSRKPAESNAAGVEETHHIIGPSTPESNPELPVAKSSPGGAPQASAAPSDLANLQEMLDAWE